MNPKLSMYVLAGCSFISAFLLLCFARYEKLAEFFPVDTILYPLLFWLFIDALTGAIDLVSKRKRRLGEEK